MGLGSVFRDAGDGVEGFCSSFFSAGGGFACTGAASFWGACFDSGLLFERDLRCELG